MQERVAVYGGSLDVVTRERPDVVLMDIRMPEVDGLEATRRITADRRLGDTRALILTTFLPDDLLTAARIVADGQALLAPRDHPASHGGVRPAVATWFRRVPRLASDGDDPRDRSAGGGRTGLSNTEIDTLFMSPATAKIHVGRPLAKLHARDRAQLVVVASEAGIVVPGGT